MSNRNTYATARNPRRKFFGVFATPAILRLLEARDGARADWDSLAAAGVAEDDSRMIDARDRFFAAVCALPAPPIVPFIDPRSGGIEP